LIALSIEADEAPKQFATIFKFQIKLTAGLYIGNICLINRKLISVSRLYKDIIAPDFLDLAGNPIAILHVDNAGGGGVHRQYHY